MSIRPPAFRPALTTSSPLRPPARPSLLSLMMNPVLVRVLPLEQSQSPHLRMSLHLAPAQHRLHWLFDLLYIRYFPTCTVR
ncbi:hypothetical protein GOP47_0006157 [Adiantum capillus-veneris]|uniref:Uncharacterized protein n=1 Tax=Adiantum capillus-veneris TaxID=13818 RepID=A0A9D4V319_ADICA|nr:hypothetical protein GOP47_0006157 [Adiantum capillus-veneris]